MSLGVGVHCPLFRRFWSEAIGPCVGWYLGASFLAACRFFSGRRGGQLCVGWVVSNTGASSISAPTVSLIATDRANVWPADPRANIASRPALKRTNGAEPVAGAKKG